ncbi:capsid protein precursor pVI [Crane-associated adenovirus 1]|uniref:Capsid protein pVI n=1 Tax=Crane-associated adenovirus 1 TaxID=2559941 RepID=A0A5H2X3C1_9ADEN|nr:capsid protein precursor pVI [Crane-associated adenovirus 1]
MDYGLLSPHIGTWALQDDHLGNSSLRGGAINWSSIGSRITSALNSTGRWLANTGNRFIHSNTFNQIKQGLKDSGIVQNAAQIAGEAVAGLTEIGRLKLQQEIEQLRNKVLNNNKQSSEQDLAQLLELLRSTKSNDQKDNAQSEQVPSTYPSPSNFTKDIKDPMQNVSNIPSTLEYVDPSIRRVNMPYRRHRKRPANWRNRLNTLSGNGVNTSVKRVCY